MTYLPVLAFLGGIGAAFLIFPFWSSLVIKERKGAIVRKGALLVDVSALLDPRLIDLALSGLLDGRLLFPRYLFKALSNEAMSEDEVEKNKARKALENIRRLEAMPELGLEILEIAPSRIGDHFVEMIVLAKSIQANFLFSDSSSQERPLHEGLKIINLHHVAQSFRSPIQGGERLSVRIQRTGKEIGQGVGYLEDGTMVVVNGAAHAVGEMVEAFVLSVKHNTAGRMVFCNTLDEQTKFISEMPDRRRIAHNK